MQSTAIDHSPAIVSAHVDLPLNVTPGFLMAAFTTVTDPRRRQGTRYPLAAILALAVIAILSNCTSVLAIAQFGADAPLALRQALGFSNGKTPRQSTVYRLFAKLNPDALIAVLAQACGQVVPPPSVRASQGVAIDGKAQRGRLAADKDAGTIHSLSAYCHEVGVVLSQAPITHATNKAEAELSVAPEVIATVDWRNRVLTGDALYCQRKICQQVCEAGGDYLILVKANQGTLFEDIRLLFEDPDPAAALIDRREATTVDSGHGRCADTRHLIASTDLLGYLDWPHHAQVFRLERTWTQKGITHHSLRYGITSVPPPIADAHALLGTKRAHWQIENRLHRPKDVTLDEDASLVHHGFGPDILAILRNLVISLLHHAGITTIAAHLRHLSRHPEDALQLLVDFSPQNA